MVKKKEQSKPSVSESSSSKIIKKMNMSTWAIVSIILGILLIVSLFTGGFSSSAKISADEAGQKIVDFASKQGASAQIVSVEEKGSLYLVTVKIQGQDVPVYVTADGENLVPSVVPLSGTTPSSNTNTQSPTPNNIPKNDKPVVELFVMSHCPYGTQMEKAMLPAVAALGDKIDFQVKFVYYAMHGEVEVYEQLNQYCIMTEQEDKYLSYLQCFLEDGDTERCLAETSVDKTKLATCAATADKQFDVTANLEDTSSYLSGRFPLFNIHEADNTKYNIGGSPTLIINGVEASVARSPSAVLDAICAAFNDAPEECNTELPTASTSAGFGYSAGAADAAAVQCGF